MSREKIAKWSSEICVWADKIVATEKSFGKLQNQIQGEKYWMLLDEICTYRPIDITHYISAISHGPFLMDCS